VQTAVEGLQVGEKSLQEATEQENIRSPSDRQLLTTEEASPLKAFGTLLLATHPSLTGAVHGRGLTVHNPVTDRGMQVKMSSGLAISADDENHLPELVSQLVSTPVVAHHQLEQPVRHGDVSMDAAVSSKKGEIKLRDVALNSAEVMDALQADIPNILEREPTWEVFSEDFTMIDQTGAKVQGLGPNKLMMKMLRQFRETFASKSDVKFDLSRAFGSIAGEIKMKLNGMRFGKTDPLVDIDAEAVLHLNDRNKVDRMEISKWHVSEQQQTDVIGETKSDIKKPAAVESASEKPTVAASSQAYREKGLLSTRVLTPVLWLLAMLGLGVQPAHAASIGGVVADTTNQSGFVQSFLLIFLSELGDKTFFIAGLLAAKYSRLLSFIGSIGALAVMTIISTLLGQIFHAVPPGITNGLPIDDYVACIAFAYFGAKTVYDAYQLPADDNSGIEEEKKEAEEAVAEVTSKESERASAIAAITQTFALVFCSRDW
jgi:putative Ca2+/H+ antiporter (TMEM165/GDT1 family)